MRSNYYIPAIILFLFMIYVAALIIFYTSKVEQIDRYAPEQIKKNFK